MSNESNVELKGIHKFIDSFTVWCTRWVPDSMVFALMLTFLIYFIALAATPHGPIMLVQDWAKGFWALLTFSMQMCVLMLTGFCVADSPPMNRLIVKFVTMFKTRTTALIGFCLFVATIYWCHWGVGLMVGIVVGREMCARNKGLGLDFRHMAAGVYCCQIMNAGLSYAPPLWLATPGHFMDKVVGVIPITQTIFDSHQLAISFMVLILYVLVVNCTKPPLHKVEEMSDEMIAEITGAEAVKETKATYTPAERMDRSFLLVGIIGAAGLLWFCQLMATKGFDGLTLDVVNFFFLMLGLILHKSIHGYMGSVARGVGTVGGVIVQFPFYAGIFGIIQFSGLSEVIAAWFVSISTAQSFPFVTYIYSAVLNFFVPSAGSKFIIEFPYIAPAAQTLGANMAYVVNAYNWGDLVTNLIQPFWAIPVLAAFNVKFQDILPYTFVAFATYAIACGIGIWFFPMLW